MRVLGPLSPTGAAHILLSCFPPFFSLFYVFFSPFFSTRELLKFPEVLMY